MKTVFHLPPANDQEGSRHLLVEVGWYGVSFAWHNDDRSTLAGVLSYNFVNNITGVEAAGFLSQVFEKELILDQPVKSVTICYNFRESLLIPGAFNNSAHFSEQLNTLYGLATNSIERNDPITLDPGIGIHENLLNIYRIPGEVHSLLLKHYPGAAIVHSTSLQLNNNSSGLQCIVFHNCIKVILNKGGKLQLVQQFLYTSPEDVAYHLVNTCDKYQVSPPKVIFQLSGMIDRESALYLEIRKYFLNVSFFQQREEHSVPLLQEFPAHFFSHLTALSTCVL